MSTSGQDKGAKVVSLRDKAAVVGIGQTEYSKESGRTELALACEAIAKAAQDAGIDVAEIDGLVRYDMDTVDEVALTSHAGLKNLSWMSHTGYGGTGGNAVVAHAAAAIASGMANTVVCYRSLNERSGKRYGRGETWMRPEVDGFEAFQMPWGMLTPAHQFGQFARRHMIEYGTTSEQFGEVAVTLRHHASRNPNAMMQKPITLGDHQASRMIADPLRLFDCCIESDGACAVIVTKADRARDTKHPPAWIMGAAQGSGTRAQGVVFRDDLSTPESTYTAASVYRSAGVSAADIDAVMIYDHFTPFVILSLEAYGFCKPGEGGAFVENGRIRFDGELPVNTHGGNHSEAYIHGLPHVIEAVRQLRGTSTSQVPDAELILSCSSVAQLSAAVILRKDR
jgi:acetyl-CoA acetyltransferase